MAEQHGVSVTHGQGAHDDEAQCKEQGWRAQAREPYGPL